MADAFTRSASIPTPGPPTDLADEPNRRRLGRYELLSCIARGGMATVWAATHGGDHGFRRLVALKLIRPELASDPSFRRMFLDEARLVSRLRHTNVVEVWDLGEEASVVFHVMPLIDGDTLGGLIRRQAERAGSKTLPFSASVRIMADVLRGLHAAHELTDEAGEKLELVHRDVSPQNILVGIDGVSKIADFGIAKAFGRLSEETDAGLFKGKLAYAAPEQVQRKKIDRRTDVFAAGVVLWEALTGVRLFKGEDIVDTLARLTSMRIDDPRRHSPDLPESIARITMRALAPSMADRFQTAEAMADAIEEASRDLTRPASTKDIASLVVDLAGQDVEERHRRIRERTRVRSAAHAEPTETEVRTDTVVYSPVLPLPKRSRSKRTRVAFVTLGVALASAVTLTLLSSKTPVTSSPARESRSTAELPPSSAPLLPPIIATEPSASAVQIASAASSARRAPPKHPASPAGRTAPPLKFGNPYAQ